MPKLNDFLWGHLFLTVGGAVCASEIGSAELRRPVFAVSQRFHWFDFVERGWVVLVGSVHFGNKYIVRVED